MLNIWFLWAPTLEGKVAFTSHDKVTTCDTNSDTISNLYSLISSKLSLHFHFQSNQLTLNTPFLPFLNHLRAALYLVLKVTFGVLFNDDKCANIFEALVGTLRAAKKRKIVAYDGELLLQGVHDNVEITLKSSQPTVSTAPVA
uniref:Costars domain-containing protein n=1 Tax=Nelumbo nucifera TaxID=4432 RepID=A0A822ZBR0_NELNU|nr:TPA_asm: hypothetical protein HUJ06_015232 [Nelumbo nucifera]